jgi:hypothetical protein
VSTFVLTDCTTWIAGHDFTADSNSVSLSVEAETQDSTTFGSGGYRERKAGLKTLAADLECFYQAGSGLIDPTVFSSLGTANEVATFSPTGAVQTTAYMAQVGKFETEFLGSVGEMAGQSLSMQGTDGLAGAVRGLVCKAKANVSATGATGSAVNLGAGAAGQYLYLTLHVFSAGTTISVKVESDTLEAFGTPADVASATITGVTAAGGTWMTRVDASAITDSWFRLNVTAITGTFSIAAAMAIQ